MKKIPIRTCIGCGAEKPKKELIRIVKTAEDAFFLDETGRMNGRGAYICRDPECIRRAWKTRGLDRSFRQPVSREIYDRLEKEMVTLADGG